MLRAAYNLSHAQQAYLDNPDPCASLTSFSKGPSASICLHFWGWTENKGTVDQSCSCGALLQAVHLRKQMSGVDCSLEATQRRLEAFFNPFGFWVFPGASAEDATCPVPPSSESKRDPGRCSTVGTWSWDGVCPREDPPSPLQRD
ncbi:hypothetical protein BCR37DRAFT_378760 [Protomyces lactucae-debilis]|uniref:Uncharacterized protein n=1 Tax=Protomyces lactucae-debilis TaxID=2754530 RepID=A0A1Y2FKN9_PROLT|nr:uncharacterized protein BCR37DRAFT_378760 [Protomyces lactucae-debilis]ORY83776.1 hypothetical protein BCR37DRAFT_378760 [Protomyces lactucae-debilis]